MKNPAFTSALGLAALLAFTTAAPAQTIIRYESQPGSKMRMDGTSTIHDWHAESQLIGGFIELDAALLDAPDKAKPGKVAAKGETFVAVRSLKCSSGKAMDAVMQEAMKEKENPRIVFKLVELTLKEVKPAQVNFDAKGSLTVSGVTKEISFPVTLVRRVDQARATFSGATAVKMTDFKMGCPIGNLALEVGDDNAAARGLINQNFHNWSEVVCGWLNAAGDRLPALTDRRQLAGFVLTTMEGAMMRARAAKSFDPFDESVAQLRAYFDHLETAARTGPAAGDSHGAS